MIRTQRNVLPPLASTQSRTTPIAICRDEYVCPFQSKRIDPAERVSPNIGILIYPAREPNRILADELLQHRVVVPRPVEVQARSVVLSAGVLQRVAAIGPERACLPVRTVGVIQRARRSYQLNRHAAAGGE